ncbi:MAG: (dimethylallyl)adenosine tRNA methylthiotransferase MiaB [Planctomycetota bacterium]|jgi:tRNA-2-methylthio-N6-dimethylallyladenosine synthase
MRVYLETFGCQMNELDSELVRGQLTSLGYQMVEEDTAAQVVLYNTCSVRELAEQKAMSRVGAVAARKRAGEQVILGVLGCMAERDGVDLMRRHPQVDILCGPAELDKLPQLIDNVRRARIAEAQALTDVDVGALRAGRGRGVALAGNSSRRSATLSAAEDGLESLDLSRAFDPGAREQPWSAYVRITRGCNKFCSYCVVPYTRGAEVHRPPDNIVEECRRLADAGAVEITLLGQTVNHYRYTHGTAVTLSGREAPQIGPGLRAFRGDAAPVARTTTFADLLRRIHEEVPALARIRFVTSYPRDFGLDVLEVMRDSPRICRYLHAPAQSGSDAVLARMNRGYTIAEYEEFVARTFSILPDATLAGDFIVGFPGETEADFEATCSLVRRLPFKNNFIFKYSPRPGTVAIDRFTDDIPDEVKRWRNNTLLAIQTETSARVHATWVGRDVPVLFDSVRGRANSAARAEPGMVALRVEGQSIAAPAPVSWQVAGRTMGDLIVAIAADSEASARALLGQQRVVRLESAHALLLNGQIVQ